LLSRFFQTLGVRMNLYNHSIPRLQPWASTNTVNPFREHTERCDKKISLLNVA
jgi:hypothetical protein